MAELPPPRTGRCSHRRRYSVPLLCDRIGGDTEAQAVTPTAWASSCRWRPCFTAWIGGWSRQHRSRRRCVERWCDRCRPVVGGEHEIRGKNHIHGMRPSGTRSTISVQRVGKTRTRGRAPEDQPDPRLLQAKEEENQSQEETRSTRLAPGENQIHRLRARRTRTTPTRQTAGKPRIQTAADTYFGTHA